MARKKRPAPALEDALVLVDPHEALAFALNKGERIPEIEAVIARSASCSFDYANQIIKDRFPAGESAIFTSGESSFLYLELLFELDRIHTLGPALSNAEAAFAHDKFYSLKYAQLIEERFPAGEAAILSNEHFATQYFLHCVDTPDPVLEQLAFKTSLVMALYYVNEVSYLRLPEELHNKVVAYAAFMPGNLPPAIVERYFEMLDLPHPSP
jgi:hypothetical protein